MSSHGTIIARVYTSRAQLPVAGATVAVTQKAADGKQRLVSLQNTDESGKTKPVPLSTPDTSASMSPGSPGDAAPFALCDLWAYAPGYEVQVVEDIQIFPGTETVQDLMLIPLPEQAPLQSRAEFVHVSPQNL